MLFKNRRRTYVLVLSVAVCGSVDFTTRPAAAQQEGRKVHALLAIDYSNDGDDVKGRLGVAEDERMITELLRSMITEGEGTEPIDANRLEIKTIGRNLLDPGMIRSAIASIEDVQATDTIFFYYAGHGGTNREKGHFLATSSGDLLRSDLLSTLQQRGARLVVLLTDCCASLVTEPQTFQDITEAKGMGHTMRCLLLQHRGTVDINAATYDSQSGFGEKGNTLQRTIDGKTVPEGGLFTWQLHRTIKYSAFTDLDQQRLGIVTWGDLIQQVGRAMEAKCQRLVQANAALGSSMTQDQREFNAYGHQRPQAFSLAVPVADSNSTARFQDRASPPFGPYQRRPGGSFAPPGPFGPGR